MRFIHQSPISFIKNVPRTNGGWGFALLGDEMNSEELQLSFRFGLRRSRVLALAQKKWDERLSKSTFLERQNVPMRVRDQKRVKEAKAESQGALQKEEKRHA